MKRGKWAGSAGRYDVEGRPTKIDLEGDSGSCTNLEEPHAVITGRQCNGGHNSRGQKEGNGGCHDSVACEGLGRVSLPPSAGVNKLVCPSVPQSVRLPPRCSKGKGMDQQAEESVAGTGPDKQKRTGRLAAAKWAQHVCNKMIVENDRQRETGSQTAQAGT